MPPSASVRTAGELTAAIRDRAVSRIIVSPGSYTFSSSMADVRRAVDDAATLDEAAATQLVARMNAVATLAWTSADRRRAAVQQAPPAVAFESPSKSEHVGALKRGRDVSHTPDQGDPRRRLHASGGLGAIAESRPGGGSDSEDEDQSRQRRAPLQAASSACSSSCVWLLAAASRATGRISTNGTISAMVH